ncbi:MAG: acyl-CoA thioesterase [Vicinamibacterales bacterium]
MPVTPISEFRLARRVQFHETDAGGVVHFSWYPRYIEEAEHAMWRAAGLSIHHPDDPHLWPRVAIALDYVAPLRFEEEFAVTIRIADFGGRSMRYACELTRAGVRIAAGSMTIACVTRDADGAFRSTAIPDAVRARFAVAGARP